MNPLHYQQLIALLRVKKRELIGLLERLQTFEQTYAVELKVIGSVPESCYWLDSDVDVYWVDPGSSEGWAAWQALGQAHPKLDLIIDPTDEYKAHIMQQGVAPAGLLKRLKAFSDEPALIDRFAQYRHDKLVRTLDNSVYPLQQVIVLKSQAVAANPAVLYGPEVKQLAFRFVWVGLMILSRYEHLLHPLGAEVANTLSVDDWWTWVDCLAHPSCDRPPFLVQDANLVAEVYGAAHQQAWQSPQAIQAGLQAWLDAFKAFDTYTREWVSENWTPQL